jgi:hypothetical protein
MISELHVRGYQQVRMIPHLYSVGTWRCGVTWLGNVRSDHGAMACDWDFSVTPQHTSANGREVFEWKDASHATPSRLAEMFVSRFPDIAKRGKGKDWEYAGWFSWMLHETYPDCLPVAFGEYLEAPPGGLVTIGTRQLTLTPPPSGRCSADLGKAAL